MLIENHSEYCYYSEGGRVIFFSLFICQTNEAGHIHLNIAAVWFINFECYKGFVGIKVFMLCMPLFAITTCCMTCDTLKVHLP